MKFNKGNNKEHHHVFSMSAVNAVAQVQSLPCLHQLNVLSMVFPCSRFLCLAFGSRFYPISPSTLFSTDKSVWQVPGSINVGANGWRA